MRIPLSSFAGARVLGTAFAAALLCGAAWSQTAAQQDPSRGRDPKPPTSTPPTSTPPTSTPPTGKPDPKPDPKPPTGTPNPPSTPPVNPPGQNAVGRTGTGDLAQKPATLPDLEIQALYGAGAIAGAPGTGYCAPMGVAGQQREVTFRVHNKGAGPSGAFHIDVQFIKLVGATVQRHFTNLNAGASHVVSVPIPNGAWENGAAHFYIHADPNNKVVESNDFNNHATSKCVQPSAS